MNDINAISLNDCHKVESFKYLPKKLPVKKLGKEYKKLAGYVKISDLARVNALFLLDEMAERTAVDANELKIHVSLEFKDLENGKVSIEIDINQEVIVTCQRCNELMPHILTVDMTALLVDPKAKVSSIYAEYEKIEVNRLGLFDFYEVLEDEIMLSLPVVMKHDETHENCKDFSNFCI